MTSKVWVLGDAVVDLLPEGDGRLLQCPGGAPANVAVGVARLGGNSGFIGRVGDDPFGHFMRQTLCQEKVDISHLSLDPAQRTSTVVVALDEHGERTFTFMVRPSADLFLQPDDLRHLRPASGCTSALSLSAPSPAGAALSRRWKRLNIPAAASASTLISAAICGRIPSCYGVVSTGRWHWLTW